MSKEAVAASAPVHRVVGPILDVLERCRGYEYYYDAYFAPDAPFGNQQPTAASIAEALQDLCQLTPQAIRALKRESMYLRQYGSKDCTAMADEAMRRGEMEDTDGNLRPNPQASPGAVGAPVDAVVGRQPSDGVQSC